ncbi:hypothetical protein BDZ89DRAFT_1064305 [Hymenopellis radicata]|nr:hypothetical protein BDZ89DRAFT_1064305 [Hymenopellis radicata]
MLSCFRRAISTQFRSPSQWRRFASSSAASETVEKGKLKPKATTPLRRSASDSLPIRANPSSTRSNIQTIFTLTTAERYALSRYRIPTGARKLVDSWWFPRWQNGEVFVFANGSFVCWGLGEKAAHQFATEVIKPMQGIELAPMREPEEEELEFVMDPNEKTRLQGDLIILGKPDAQGEHTQSLSGVDLVYPAETVLSRYAFSQALARSTALSALEVGLDDYLSSMATFPHILVQTGKPGLGRKALIKKLGELMKFRQSLNLNRENYLDIPDFYWTAEPELESHFLGMSTALEIEARTESVNERITYAAELQSTLRQLLTESSSHMLELVIIALIAVEVVVVFIRDGPELWHMLTDRIRGESNEKTTPESS